MARRSTQRRAAPHAFGVVRPARWLSLGVARRVVDAEAVACQALSESRPSARDPACHSTQKLRGARWPSPKRSSAREGSFALDNREPDRARSAAPTTELPPPLAECTTSGGDSIVIAAPRATRDRVISDEVRPQSALGLRGTAAGSPHNRSSSPGDDRWPCGQQV